MEYCYEILDYEHSLSEAIKHLPYGSRTDIWGNTRFFRTGLFSGSGGMNDETGFPLRVIEKKDALNYQAFFYPGIQRAEIKLYSLGRLRYLSLEHAISYREAMTLISDLKHYGEVSWLWVDTYGQSDINDNPVTIQNPFDYSLQYKEDSLSVHGIPIYYDGVHVDEPLERFLDILNQTAESGGKNSVREKSGRLNRG